MLLPLNTNYFPNKVILFKKESDFSLEEIAGFIKNMRTVDNKTTAYICRGFVCARPITEAKDVVRCMTEDSPLQ